MNVTSTTKKENKIFKPKKVKLKTVIDSEKELRNDKNIWIKMLGGKKYTQLREMNNSNVYITRWQKRRFLKTMFFLPVVATTYLATKDFKFALGGFLVMGMFYYMEAKNINMYYTQFKFERHMEFAKFTRLLVPFLKKKDDNNNMWSIFNKLLDRLKYETDKVLLMALMNDMVSDPHNIEPFETFARKMSNTDNSHLFMGTIFDIREGSADLDVIEELDRLSSEELMEGIESIIEYKSKKFNMFPTKLTMVVFLPIIGYFAGFVLNTIKDFNFLN